MRRFLEIVSALAFFLPAIPDCGPAPGWALYRDLAQGFELSYPAGSKVGVWGAAVRIDLPFSPGTTLREKYLLLGMAEPAGPGPAEPVLIGGRPWALRHGEEGAAGSVYEYWSYTTRLPTGIPVTLTFVLHRVNPRVFDIPPPEFDREVETAVFEEILSSFHTFAPLRPGSSR